MHQTLEASVAALIGELPAVAPVTEGMAAEPGAAEAGTGPAEIRTGPGAGVSPALADSIRRELRQTIEKLRTLLDRLERDSP